MSAHLARSESVRGGGTRRGPARFAASLSFVLLTVPLLTPTARSQAQSPLRLSADSATLHAALTARLDAYRSASGVPGLSLAVVLPDGRLVAAVSGMADTARREPMRPDARLLMGSVGKTYVAAIALQLVGEGRLVLDTLAAAYLGGEGWYDSLPNARAITVRQLMNHTSGLVRYEFRDDFTRALTASPDKAWDPRDQIRFLHGLEAPFAAGAGWDYSDTNYLVLALILERILQRPIDAVIAERLLAPWGLAATIPSDSVHLSGVVQGYAGPNNPFGGSDAMWRDGRMLINPQFEGAGGGYAATAADAARWGALYFGGRVLGDAMLREATAGVPAAPLGPGTRYGLGMILRDSTAAGPVRGHSGFFPGYLAELRHYPTSGVTVALLVNTSAVRMRPPMARWVDELVAELIRSH